MRKVFELIWTRRGLTWSLSAVTFVGFTIYNVVGRGLNFPLSVAFAIMSGLIAYVFFWIVLKASSIPDP